MRSTSHVSPTCSDHFRMMMLDCRVHNYGPFSSDCSLWRLLNLFFLMKGTWCWWSVNVLLMHNNVCVYICSWKDTGGINWSSLVLLLHSCIKCVRGVQTLLHSSSAHKRSGIEWELLLLPLPVGRLTWEMRKTLVLLWWLIEILAVEYGLIMLLLLLLLQVLCLEFIHNFHSRVFLDRWRVDYSGVFKVILCQN